MQRIAFQVKGSPCRSYCRHKTTKAFPSKDPSKRRIQLSFNLLTLQAQKKKDKKDGFSNYMNKFQACLTNSR